MKYYVDKKNTIYKDKLVFYLYIVTYLKMGEHLY